MSRSGIAPAPRESRVRLPGAAEFDAAAIFAFLAPRIVPSLERLGPGRYERAVLVRSMPALLRVDVRSTPAGDPHLRVRLDPPVPAPEARALVTRLFDLDADLGDFRTIAARDRRLRAVVARRPGLRLIQVPDPFEGLIRAILGQQVSVPAAHTLIDRLVRRFGTHLAERDGHRFYAFPPARVLAAAGPDAIREIGLTRSKAATIQAAACAVAEGRLDWKALRAGPPEEAQRCLIGIPGVGPWTASYVRMRALGDRDAFPETDLGLVKALAPGGGGRRPGSAAVLARAEPWRPWRAYAALHLWNALAEGA